jgi:hypothetical protein
MMSAPTEKLLNDPQHWRERAAEARSHAEFTDPEARSAMLLVADGYERVAKRAELRLLAAKLS